MLRCSLRSIEVAENAGVYLRHPRGRGGSIPGRTTLVVALDGRRASTRYLRMSGMPDHSGSDFPDSTGAGAIPLTGKDLYRGVRDTYLPHLSVSPSPKRSHSERASRENFRYIGRFNFTT